MRTVPSASTTLKAGVVAWFMASLIFGRAPEQNKNRENRERHPGFQHDAGGIFCRRDVAVIFLRWPLAAHIVGDIACGSGGNGGAFGLVVVEAPDFFRFPDEEKSNRRENGNDRAGDVDEIAIDVIGPEKLRDGKRYADDENCRENFECVRPSDHGAHEPEGNDDRGEGKNAADHRADVGFGKPRYGSERVDGSADCAPGDGRGVGDEVERSGVERAEAEANHERAGDCDRRAESGATFDKRAEAECDEQNLQAAIRRDARDGLLHDFELAGFDGNIVEVHCREHDPRNFQDAKRHAISKSRNGKCGRHVKDENADDDGGESAGDCTPVRLHFQSGEQCEEHDDGQRGNERREPPMAKGIVDLGPIHEVLLRGVSVHTSTRSARSYILGNGESQDEP